MIEIENVSYTYPGGPTAVKGVTLKVGRGESIGIIGHSGAGKTTLVKLAAGILKPTKGRVLVDGLDTRDISVSELARKVGYIFQNPDMMLFSSTIYDEVAFALRNFGYEKKEVEERVLRALKNVDLNKPLESSPHALSFGEKHRLAIACVLALEPEVIILDEPTTGLDYARCAALFNTLIKLNRQGNSIIVVSHDTDLLARFTKRIVALENGSVVRDGPSREVLRDIKFLTGHGFVPTQLQVLASRLEDCAPTPEEVAKMIARSKSIQ
ncbi:MAG: ABC transporter ATP-binding protein [Thermofilaceae archaeon]